MGYFNILTNTSRQYIYSTTLFQSTLTHNSLFQYITFPTDVLGNTLDMIITNHNSSLVSKCNLSELVSDHYAISFMLNVGGIRYYVNFT